jgi:hypothetical protein
MCTVFVVVLLLLRVRARHNCKSGRHGSFSTATKKSEKECSVFRDVTPFSPLKIPENRTPHIHGC